MKEEIINLCSLIKQCKCNCGSNKYEGSCCKYCGTKNDTFNQLTTSLLKAIQFCEFDDDILLSLNSISYLNILEINEIINKYQFNNYLNNKLNEINNRIVNKQYQNEDLKYLLYFIENGFYNQENIMYISNFLMTNLCCGKIETNIENQLRMIVIYTENIMKAVHPMVSKPKCILEELNQDTMGESLYNIIMLDKNNIITKLQDNDYYDIISTIFHECTHTFQHYTLSSNESVNYALLLMAKEKIISLKINNYYDENYIKFTSEIDARISQNILLLQFIENNNLNISEDYKNKINYNINLDRKLMMDETRKINGKTTDVDTLFEMLDLDSNILDRYPILKFQYKNENGKIINKTKEELIAEYNNYLNGNMIINGDKIYIDYLYNSLINKSNVIEGIKR